MGFALFSGARFDDDALRLWRISLNWIRYGSPVFNHGTRTLGMEQPLWMTLLTAGLALGGRASMERSLAIAIIAGLVAQGPLVLLAMPAIYRLIGGARADEMRSL